MRKRALAFTVTGLVWALMASADEPWKGKPFERWDEKDVQRILNDSPWARKVDLLVAGGGGTRALNPIGGQTSGAVTTGGGRRVAGGSEATAVGVKPLTFIARWSSSRTIRQAEARASELQGASKAEVDKRLAAKPQAYVFTLIGPLESFGLAGEDAVKQSSYLEMKKPHQKIGPSKVAFVKGQEGRSIVAVFFEFPKNSANGEAAIAADEKSVDFVTSVGKTSLRFHFDLTKMKDVQGLDL